MGKLSRRSMLTNSALLLPSLAMSTPFSENIGEVSGTNRKLKIVVVGGHPDDPESGCGGTIALYTDQEHEVVIVYLTRGEAGVRRKSFEEAAAIRTAEAQKACAILKARHIFAGQIDGNTEINKSTYEAFQKILDVEKPNVVFTHWPVDSHRDHRAASLLAYDAWLNGGKRFALYYFEVEQGEQTQVFHPTHYVDISQTASRKRDACLAHASQYPEKSFLPLHDTMARFRGIESGTPLAEAFIRHCHDGASVLPES